MAERQGVEIDYCPKCRGVWLDRGELEKIIERSSSAVDEVPDRYRNTRGRLDDDDYRDREEVDRRYDDDGRHGKYRKRKSWLGELFDFD